jgi:hypothetical protein
MNDKLTVLLDRIKQLEMELLVEVEKKQQQFSYVIHDGKVHFKEGVKARHKLLATNLMRFLYESKPLSILSTPMILFCALPVLFLDFVAVLFQFICFPVYGIPKVPRKDYVVMDRRKLSYLNSIEKWNCVYCEYVNGVLAYVQEIAGRTAAIRISSTTVTPSSTASASNKCVAISMI